MSTSYSFGISSLSFLYLAAVCSSLNVSCTHLVVFDSAVQVGWTITDLVLDHREPSFLQDALASCTCNTPRFHLSTYLPHHLEMDSIITTAFSSNWKFKAQLSDKRQGTLQLDCFKILDVFFVFFLLTLL